MTVIVFDQHGQSFPVRRELGAAHMGAVEEGGDGDGLLAPKSSWGGEQGKSQYRPGTKSRGGVDPGISRYD
jgi:hypothetical protein